MFAAGDNPVIQATGDGIEHTPEEYAILLQKIASYSRARRLLNRRRRGEARAGRRGRPRQETAVWVSTGTLANHLAVRLLAGGRRRVLVQQESHLFNDCGDCCQTLSGLHLVSLAVGKATFTIEDIEREVARGASGRVSVPVGAIQIETPVRRKAGEVFDFDEMKRISGWARERGIGMHLDGARLYLAAAYGGRHVREYAASFDTVYVSMYKFFNAASGAVLAGPKSLLDNLFQETPHVWQRASPGVAVCGRGVSFLRRVLDSLCQSGGQFRGGNRRAQG